MSATSRIYVAASYTENGVVEEWPPAGLSEPIDTSTLTGGGQSIIRGTLAASTGALVYQRSITGAFERMFIRIVGSGACYAAVELADAADISTKRQWSPLPNLSCRCPIILTSDDGLTHATASNYTASDGSSLPALWSDGSRATAFVRSVALKNTSSTAAVSYEIVIQK